MEIQDEYKNIDYFNMDNCLAILKEVNPNIEKLTTPVRLYLKLETKKILLQRSIRFIFAFTRALYMYKRHITHCLHYEYQITPLNLDKVGHLSDHSTALDELYKYITRTFLPKNYHFYQWIISFSNSGISFYQPQSVHKIQ